MKQNGALYVVFLSTPSTLTPQASGLQHRPGQEACCRVAHRRRSVDDPGVGSDLWFLLGFIECFVCCFLLLFGGFWFWLWLLMLLFVDDVDCLVVCPTKKRDVRSSPSFFLQLYPCHTIHPGFPVLRDHSTEEIALLPNGSAGAVLVDVQNPQRFKGAAVAQNPTSYPPCAHPAVETIVG